MNRKLDEKLDRLLKEAYPKAEVSPDFTFQLWKRLMNEPIQAPWILPVPALELAAVLGIVVGLWTWQATGFSTQQLGWPSQIRQVTRLDLFGNAPFDSLAGSYLTLTKETQG